MCEPSSSHDPYFAFEMKFLAITFFVTLLQATAHAGGDANASAQVENAIHRHITRLRAIEYREARRVTTVNGTTVAIYTAEGACEGFDLQATPGTCSNNWVRYMIAISGNRTTLPLEVGGKGDLSDTKTTISEGVIEISGLSFSPGDSLCCPSVPKTKKYQITPSGLSQIVRPER
jgi:hypothetical protein